MFQTTEICFALSTSDNRQRIINIAIVTLATSLKISLIYSQQPISKLTNVKNRTIMHDRLEGNNIFKQAVHSIHTIFN